MKAKEFDRKFDEEEDISQYRYFSKAQRSALEQQRVNVDFPARMIKPLDKEVKRLGVPRQSTINYGWLNAGKRHPENRKAGLIQNSEGYFIV
jgi:hypothetical protein